MRLVRNFPQYYCKKVALALEASPTVPVKGFSTRDKLSTLDKKIMMDICFLNGATCTNLQDYWYDPTRRKQYYCVDRPFAQLDGSPVSPVDDPSAADTYEIRVDDQYCLDFNDIGCYAIGRQCWAHVIDNAMHGFFCKIMSNIKVIDATVSASTKSLAARVERSSNSGSGDCMERINTPRTQDHMMTHNCPVGPENCTPRCSESDLCYFDFNTLGEPAYLCDANPIFSFIEPVPAVKLNTRGAIQTSEEVIPSKCD
jgi:hypothetical protein